MPDFRNSASVGGRFKDTLTTIPGRIYCARIHLSPTTSQQITALSQSCYNGRVSILLSHKPFSVN